MPSTLLHPASQQALEALRAQHVQGILLHGEQGVALAAAAQMLANGTFASHLTPVDSKGEPTPDGSISVELIRELYTTTRTQAAHQRYIFIQHAHTMTESAQNALLKLLEEPNATTSFILTTHRPLALLPTIRSRVMQQYIARCTPHQSRALLAQHTLPESEHPQLLFIAEGRPELLTLLATTPKLRTQYIARMKDAKTLLEGERFDRLRVALEYAKQRTSAVALLDAAIALSAFHLRRHFSLATLKRTQTLIAAQQAIEKNAQARLQLLKSVL